ncbi:hypothetical protein [Erythrobacter litoralis]|uniref:Uncharacterized protein n=1 Tax=Erythrobacter litoralis (strain HTCC2594) TaxID=314225 RepID=Q2NC80_ERYLH|nr:hypothetical protein [Erythrobacter litoralis]ABC62711.1 hypothetical protein ELI_03095 [Erythrobacter litoralis HTCC2594]
MSIEGAIPAIAGVAVSLAGLLVTFLNTRKYDAEVAQAKQDIHKNLHDIDVVVEVDDIRRALSSKGLSEEQVSELIGEIRTKDISVQAKVAES